MVGHECLYSVDDNGETFIWDAQITTETGKGPTGVTVLHPRKLGKKPKSMWIPAKNCMEESPEREMTERIAEKLHNGWSRDKPVSQSLNDSPPPEKKRSSRGKRKPAKGKNTELPVRDDWF